MSDHITTFYYGTAPVDTDRLVVQSAPDDVLDAMRIWLRGKVHHGDECPVALVQSGDQIVFAIPRHVWTCRSDEGDFPAVIGELLPHPGPSEIQEAAAFCRSWGVPPIFRWRLTHHYI